HSMPPVVGGEGMTGNREPGSATPSTSDAGEHGHHPQHASRRAHHAPLGAGVKATPATRVDLRSSLDTDPLAGVCLHRAGNQDPAVTNSWPKGVDRPRPFQG